MRLTLVTGGARSGKSAWAQRRALELGGEAVTVVVTARAGDAEMGRRIERHRRDRPATWRTLEAPVDAAAAVRAAPSATVLLDCLTVLVANAVLAAPAGEAAALEAAAAEVAALLRAADGRDGALLVVTNEVGMGVVPGTELGRWFRDALGGANQRLAGRAAEVVLLVSGVALPVKP